MLSFLYGLDEMNTLWGLKSAASTTHQAESQTSGQCCTVNLPIERRILDTLQGDITRYLVRTSGCNLYASFMSIYRQWKKEVKRQAAIKEKRRWCTMRKGGELKHAGALLRQIMVVEAAALTGEKRPIDWLKATVFASIRLCQYQSKKTYSWQRTRFQAPAAGSEQDAKRLAWLLDLSCTNAERI